MEEIGLEKARGSLGELVDKARLAGEPTRITRQGKPAAVIVSHELFTAAMYYVANTMDQVTLPDDVWPVLSETLHAGLRAIGLEQDHG